MHQHNKPGARAKARNSDSADWVFADGGVHVHAAVVVIDHGHDIVVAVVDTARTRAASARVPPLRGAATARQFAALTAPDGATVADANTAYGTQYAGSGGQGVASAGRWHTAMAARAAIAGAEARFGAAPAAMARDGAAVALAGFGQRDRARARAYIGTPDAAMAVARRWARAAAAADAKAARRADAAARRSKRGRA